MDRLQRIRCLTAGAIVLALACGSKESDATPTDQYANLLAFDTARVRLISGRDTSTLTVELAETPDQHAMGLMERRVLPAEAGMLFLYPNVQPESSAFWMFRTRIPLDIAFIDSLGGIRTIEVNAGYFARKHIRVGDRVLLQDTATRHRVSRPPT